MSDIRRVGLECWSCAGRRGSGDLAYVITYRLELAQSLIGCRRAIVTGNCLDSPALGLRDWALERASSQVPSLLRNLSSAMRDCADVLCRRTQWRGFQTGVDTAGEWAGYPSKELLRMLDEETKAAAELEQSDYSGLSSEADYSGLPDEALSGLPSGSVMIEITELRIDVGVNEIYLEEEEIDLAIFVEGEP
jgi:hypothetical protein